MKIFKFQASQINFMFELPPNSFHKYCWEIIEVLSKYWNLRFSTIDQKLISPPIASGTTVVCSWELGFKLLLTLFQPYFEVHSATFTPSSTQMFMKITWKFISSIFVHNIVLCIVQCLGRVLRGSWAGSVNDHSPSIWPLCLDRLWQRCQGLWVCVTWRVVVCVALLGVFSVTCVATLHTEWLFSAWLDLYKASGDQDTDSFILIKGFSKCPFLLCFLCFLLFILCSLFH